MLMIRVVLITLEIIILNWFEDGKKNYEFNGSLTKNVIGTLQAKIPIMIYFESEICIGIYRNRIILIKLRQIPIARIFE